MTNVDFEKWQKKKAKKKKKEEEADDFRDSHMREKGGQG